jgi:hypothetical protein
MAMNLNQGKVKGFAQGAHSADQPTQSDKPVGPFPNSPTADPVKKDGGA